VCPAAEDVFTGVWRPDESKVKLTPGASQVRSLRIGTDATQVTITYQGTDFNGQPNEWSIRASYGGNLSGVLGCPEMDAVRCWRSTDRSILLKMSRNAETVGWETLEVGKNGKTLRLTHASVDPQGKETKTIVTLDKQ
jgi:hypothetical protein